jgi:membrane protein
VSARKETEQKLPGVNWRSTTEVKGLGKELVQEVKDDRVTSLAAAFAYHTVFAIPALLILTLTVAALIDGVTSVQVTQNLRDLIQDRAPAETKDLLNSIVNNAIARVGSGGASLGLITTAALALWSGSNAVNALVESFNLAYGVDEGRPFLKKKAVVLGLTLLLALLINLSFVLLVFGERIGSWIAERAGFGGAFDVVWNIFRWPLAILIIAFILAVLYYAGPNIEQSFRWISPGSILATVLWVIATAGFGIYLRFSNPGSAYGVLGSVLVLLFYLYVTGIVFLIGAELNALIGRKYDPETAKDLASRPDAEPEKRADARRQLSRART